MLASLLYLTTLLLLDRAAAGWPGWRGALSWAGAGIAWFVGMGAKTIAISAPGAFLLDQAVVAPAGERGAGPLRRRIVRALLLAAPLLALSAWSAFLHLRSFEANPGGGAGFGATAVGAGDYFLTQLRVQWLYLRLLAWPDALTFDRSFTPSNGLDGAVLAAAAGVAALLAIAGWLWLRAERARTPRPAERLAAFGILFWFVALAPTSSFIPVADLAVEHRVYLACLGPFLAAVVGVDALLQPAAPPPARRGGRRGARLPGAALAGARARRPGAGLGLGGGALGVGCRRLAGERPGLDQPGAGPEQAGRPGRRRGGLRARLVGGGEPGTGRQPGPQPRRAPHPGGTPRRGARRARPGHGVRPRRLLAARQPGRRVWATSGAPSRPSRRPARAARAAPGDPLMRNLLGQALSVKGDWPGALAEFQAAEGLDPGNPLYPVAAGVALSSLGRRDEACAAFRRAGARSGSRPLPLDAARRASALGCPILAP